LKWLLTYPESRPAVGNYTAWLDRAGIEWLIIRPSNRISASCKRCDALLLTGGGDVAPAFYGEKTVHPKTGDIDSARDSQECRLIRTFLAEGKPVFGICRGIQILAVEFGGRLIQHIPDFLAEQTGPKRPAEKHSGSRGKDAVHAIEWIGNSRMGAALGKPGRTNSSHHQAVAHNTPGASMRIAAISSAGIVEAFESFETKAPVSAVQWHPERLAPDNPASAGLIAHWKTLV